MSRSNPVARISFTDVVTESLIFRIPVIVLSVRAVSVSRLDVVKKLRMVSEEGYRVLNVVKVLPTNRLYVLILLVPSKLLSGGLIAWSLTVNSPEFARILP